MKGRYSIRIRNKKLDYHLEIDRKITVILGDSATGKTSMVNMVEDYEEQGSSVEIDSKVDLVVLNSSNWEYRMDKIKNNTIFIMDENPIINEREFARKVKESGCYFIFITREFLDQYPISTKSIYEFKDKDGKLKRKYDKDFILKQNFYKNSSILVEDSNSGLEMYKSLVNVDCISSEGKSKIYNSIEDKDYQFIIVDGEAFGNELLEVEKVLDKKIYSSIFFPPSFEFIVLKSIFKNERDLIDILENVEEFVESSEFLSLERFYTNLLISYTSKLEDYKLYSKTELKEWYRSDINKRNFLNFINENYEIDLTKIGDKGKSIYNQDDFRWS